MDKTNNDLFTVSGRIGGKEFSQSNVERLKVKDYRTSLYEENKENIKPNDFIVVTDGENKIFFKPTPIALVLCRSYAWVITKDRDPQPEAKEGTTGNAKGLIGPKNGLPLSFDEIVNHPKGQKFRMLDDDNNVYYEGVFVDVNNRYSGFEPKDDFGEPNAGCTTIQYLENNVWKTL